MGESLNNDRRGFSDPWGPTLQQASRAPAKVDLNPLVGPATKLAPPFLEVVIGGRVYRGKPWRKTGRIVLPDSGLTSTAADLMAKAEGLAASEAAATAMVCSFDCPRGSIAIATGLRVRFGDNLALQWVKLQLVSGGDQASNAQSGDSGLVVAGEQQSFVEVDEEVDVLFRSRPNTRFKVIAINTDTEAPHYVTATLTGVIFPTSILAPNGPEPEI